MLLNVVHRQVHENITKESGGFHNHSNLLTMVELQNERRTKFEKNMAQKSLQSLGWNLTSVIHFLTESFRCLDEQLNTFSIEYFNISVFTRSDLERED